MKFTIQTPTGVEKTIESNDQAQIKILIARGWKEVSSSKKIPNKKSKK